MHQHRLYEWCSQNMPVFRRDLRKFFRFLMIYGVGRSVFKVAARLRIGVPLLRIARPRQDVGIVGCGQFAFSTVGYVLWREYGLRICTCYDINQDAQMSFARAFGIRERANNIDDVINYKGLRTVYITSNHASHADYAVAAIRRGLDVYIEKPISVNREQLVTLLREMRNSSARVYAGYNRPFAAATRILRKEIVLDSQDGISMQCFVSGHKIAVDHWYRRPTEGTRVCGNLGHWIDLAVHVLSWRGLPDKLQVSVVAANESEMDDNLAVSFNSDRGDIVSLMMTSRCEPFEGINETINIQHNNTICKIDDFQRMIIWQGRRRIAKRFWPKDVGHRSAILQPFRRNEQRNWREVVLSTLLMLHIADMVRNRCGLSAFSFVESWDRLASEVKSA